MARRGGRRAGGAGKWIGLLALTALGAGAVGLMLGSGRDGAVAGVGADVAGGLGSIVSAPVRWVGDAGGFVGSYFGGAGEIRRLRAENDALLQWRDQARAMAERLDAYEKLNRIQGETVGQGVAGRLVAESAGPFTRAGVVNVGRRQGVGVNWIAVNENGLVGRVIAVGDGSARVLLLGDGDSRVPVMGETTRARAIVTGDKEPAPRLNHLNAPALIGDGERLMTSGDDGIFPRGIAVGVAGKAPDGRWRVRLASDRGAIDFVRLVPPSNFPPPLEPVTRPDLAAPPQATGDAALSANAVLPLAPGAAAVPVAGTPEAVRAAQAEAARIEADRKLREEARRLAAERDAAREAARRAEAARAAAERRTGEPKGGSTEAAGGASSPVAVAPAAVEDAKAKAAPANGAASAAPPPEPTPAPAPAAAPPS